jgi:hypothetical protein
MFDPRTIRRDRKSMLSDLWHRLRWGGAIAVMIMFLPRILEVLK